MLVARCESAGARVTPVESPVTGGSGMVELATLEAVALVPATWPAADGVCWWLRGDVNLAAAGGAWGGRRVAGGRAVARGAAGDVAVPPRRWALCAARQ